MRTPEELQQIHDQMMVYLKNLIEQNLKFEVCLAATREIIRTDYNAVEMTTFQALLPFAIMEDTLSIMIDTATPEKVYHEIIKNIYTAKKLDIAVNGGRKKRKADSNRGESLTKEQQILLFVEINYLRTYKNMTQAQIADFIDTNHVAGIKRFHSDQSKDVGRFIDLIKTIKKTTDKISPSNYLI